MQISTEFTEIPVAGKAMRSFLAHPARTGSYPGILLFSDIYQLTGPMTRACARLAGYGFVVLAHEIFHRREPAGTKLSTDEAGRDRGLHHADNTQVAHYDEDCRAALDWLQQHPSIQKDQLGAGGFCIGGHLAFRAAFQPDIKATVCFYPSWLHSGRLGVGHHSRSLERAGEISGALLLIFGQRDALLDEAGRNSIERALQQAAVRYQTKLYDAEHAFMRDDRAAYDPEAADQAFAEAVAFYRRFLSR